MRNVAGQLASPMTHRKPTVKDFPMDITWQNAITLALVIAAAWYVVRRFYRIAKGKRRLGRDRGFGGSGGGTL